MASHQCESSGVKTAASGPHSVSTTEPLMDPTMESTDELIAAYGALELSDEGLDEIESQPGDSRRRLVLDQGQQDDRGVIRCPGQGGGTSTDRGLHSVVPGTGYTQTVLASTEQRMGEHVATDKMDYVEETAVVGEGLQKVTIHGQHLIDRVGRCGKAIWNWGKSFARDFNKRLIYWSKQMERTKGRRDSHGIFLFKEAQAQYIRALHHQNDYWRQRAKQFWLQAGDTNSAFFHNTVRRRRQNNHISKLRDDDGAWVERGNTFDTLVTSYFDKLLSPVDGCMDPILNSVMPKVSSAHNSALECFNRYFSKYGDVIDSVIMMDKVEVKRTVPREDTPFRRESKTKKIFVGGIPPTLTEEYRKMVRKHYMAGEAFDS
nr:uncharacterized protein LOC109167502 [Ipomoea batatas]